MSAVREGLVICAKAGTNPPKVRPGVVVAVVGQECLVAFGTSVAEDHHSGQAPILALEAGRRAALALQLDRTTYFYSRDILRIPASELQEWRDGRRVCAYPNLQLLAQAARDKFPGFFGAP